jgi:hypothetical protein
VFVLASSKLLLPLQEFVFEIFVDVVDGALVIDADFAINAQGVNPLQILGEVSSSIGGLLVGSGGKFNSIVSSFGSAFNSATQLFNSIATDERIALSLDANLNAKVRLELSFNDITFRTINNDLSMSLLARIKDTFDVNIGSFGELHIIPSIQLQLQAENTATPFDMIQNPSALAECEFEGIVTVNVDNIPMAISLIAHSTDLPNAAALDFEARLDIDLVPISDSEYFARYDFILVASSRPNIYISDVQKSMQFWMKLVPFHIQRGLQILLPTFPILTWHVFQLQEKCS